MRVERIADRHDVASFTCGNKALDDWLHVHAAENDRRDLSRVFLLVDDAHSIAGYVALTMGGVRKAELPSKLARGLPDLQISAVLIARLAIASDHKGQGLGRDVLVHAVERAVVAAESVAARFIAVDPIDEDARQFYAQPRLP
ncbi:MAG: GNAT family N-acetyltransferase [Ilumatobacteraceae bacterium]